MRSVTVTVACDRGTFTAPEGASQNNHQSVFWFSGVHSLTETEMFSVDVSTESSGRLQQLQFCRQPVPCSVQSWECRELSHALLPVLLLFDCLQLCLRCVDAVGWAAGRASGL